MDEKPLTYVDAGVDIDRADNLVHTIKAIARKTRVPGVMGEIGGFGGLFSLNVANMESPVLVSSTPTSSKVSAVGVMTPAAP